MEFLPEKCKNILDIGSGLGGINILLNDLYSKKTKVFLVDGEADSPVYNVETTYNNMSVAKQFLIDNGVSEVTYSTPDAISTETYKKPKQKFDLVVSVDACGFRFSPEMYIEFIKENTKKGAILIFDVRSHKEDWKKILSDNFEVVGIVDTTDKRERIIYKVV
jgi:SAM-dependent methyltransferase